ncbi:MAG TPA: hypothetical protein VHB98_11140 [Chloroflexota bacterium]|nr:hypothetical protein [Chloroflexota bacterium]
MSTDGSALGYAELLRLATAKGLQELDSTIVQVPSEQNHGHAVVVAGVRTSAALYRAVGEAWWDGAPAQRQQALVVAEIRAKTRALCEAVGMPQSHADDIPAAARQSASAAGAVVRGAPMPPEGALGRSAEQPPVAPRRIEAMTPAAADDTGLPAQHSTRAVTPETLTPPAVQAHVASSVGASGDQGTAALSHAVSDTDESSAPSPRQRPQPARPPARPPSPAGEGLGPDILQKLLQMTQRIGELKQEELTEEEALAKLDSFFQRAFSHPMAEGTRMEGQRVVQRLASDLARLSQERGEQGAYVAS